MNYLIVHPDNQEKLAAVKAALKALKVDFDEAKTIYNPEFVAKMAGSKRIIKLAG